MSRFTQNSFRRKSMRFKKTMPKKILTNLSVALAVLTLFLSLPLSSSHAVVFAKRVHGLALYGEVALKRGFKHFPYANPRAPKGGKVVLGTQGGFDSFNPYSLKGRTPAGLGLLFESLTVSGDDEAFSRYGRLASSMRLGKEGDSITYFLNSKARWHDGKPVVPEDVIFSFEAALAEGANPLYRQYYAGIEGIEKSGARAVTFRFAQSIAEGNRELPLIIGELPIVAQHDWQNRDIAATTLDPPLGSGPYKIGNFEAGRTFTLERVKNYWGAQEGFARGLYNFDTIRYDDYRDANVIVEALKAGKIDFRNENSSKAWAVSYKGDALTQGRLIKKLVPLDLPQGMQGYAFNLRRDLFRDPALREAIAYAFDFTWSNKTLFYGQYKRTRSYFDNSSLAATGVPKGKELALLSPYRKELPARLFSEPYDPPKSDGTPRGLRKNLQHADRLLFEAGYKIADGVRLTPQGKPIVFELLLFDPLQERIALPFAKNLQRLGITMRVRTVDAAQYVARLEKFDYDILVAAWGQSSSPGNEQRAMWTSQAAELRGSPNYTGVKHAVLDALVEKVIAAKDRDELETSVRALDRVLQWQFLVVPHFHIASARIVYWDRFGMPKRFPRQSAPSISTWWLRDAG